MSKNNTDIPICKVCKGKNSENCTVCEGTGVELLDENNLDIKLFGESDNLEFDNNLLEDE